VTVLAVAMTVAMVACGQGATGNAAHIGKAHVDFLVWPSGTGYTKVANADITEKNGTITVKVAHDYDMVNKGVELDMRGFFNRFGEAWGKDLWFRRSDNSYAANEVGRAYEIKAGTSNVWIRSGVTPEEVWTENSGNMSSRVMLCKGVDGKILNYVFFANENVTKKEVVYTIRTHNGMTHTLTVAIEKKPAPVTQG